MTPDEMAQAFNDGETVETVGGGSYATKEITVIGVRFSKGKDLNDDYYKNKNPDTWFLVFELEAGDVRFEQMQMLFFNQDGTLLSPLIPSYTAKDGSEKPASTAYDIWEAIAEFMEKNGEAKELAELRKNTKGLSKERFLNRVFVMGLRVAERKDGTEFVVLQTSYQKFKDEQNKAKSKGGDDTEDIDIDPDEVDAAIGDDEFPV